MSKKERDSLVVLERVKRGEMKLAEAARVLRISYRQCGRRMKRYKEEGAAGLVHGLRGGTGNRKVPEEVRRAITELYRGRYEGFGPVLFAEKLEAAHRIKVDHETVRRLLIKEGLWQAAVKRKERHQAWRERRAHFGEMVQMDGSHHRWFEERGGKCCLMVMIDDATGIRMSMFAEEETTGAAMRLLWKWIERYGVPRFLYTDGKSVFVPSEKDEEKARIEGRESLTQFGRSCRKLGIRIIRARSPQAKGRVERSNGVYQDRLVKELRLEGVNSIEAANAVLGNGFDQELNRRFSVEAREAADYHRPAAGHDLADILCIEEERTLSVNWTLSFENHIYQVAAASHNYSPVSRKVQVRRYLDGRLHMFYRGREIDFKEIPPPKKKPSGRDLPHGMNKPAPPAADHLWRRYKTAGL
jgi:transposase